jgi:polyisoprenoid-binding protein YceI
VILRGEMKRRWHTHSLVRHAWIFVLSVVVAASARPQAPQQAVQPNPELTLNLDLAQSKLHWTLGSTLHTVHGTFTLKSGKLQFDLASGRASGEFIASAASGESGNDSRDSKMRREILESALYPEVIFRPTRIDGKVAVAGSSDVQLQGRFILHGSEHEITVPVHAELTANHWKGSAKFSVPYIQWGLKSPNTFLLKADPAVDIDLDLVGTMQGNAAR